MASAADLDEDPAINYDLEGLRALEDVSKGRYDSGSLDSSADDTEDGKEGGVQARLGSFFGGSSGADNRVTAAVGAAVVAVAALCLRVVFQRNRGRSQSRKRPTSQARHANESGSSQSSSSLHTPGQECTSHAPWPPGSPLQRAEVGSRHPSALQRTVPASSAGDDSTATGDVQEQRRESSKGLPRPKRKGPAGRGMGSGAREMASREHNRAAERGAGHQEQGNGPVAAPASPGPKRRAAPPSGQAPRERDQAPPEEAALEKERPAAEHAHASAAPTVQHAGTMSTRPARRRPLPMLGADNRVATIPRAGARPEAVPAVLAPGGVSTRGAAEPAAPVPSEGLQAQHSSSPRPASAADQGPAAESAAADADASAQVSVVSEDRVAGKAQVGDGDGDGERNGAGAGRVAEGASGQVAELDASAVPAGRPGAQQPLDGHAEVQGAGEHQEGLVGMGALPTSAGTSTAATERPGAGGVGAGGSGACKREPARGAGGAAGKEGSRVHGAMAAAGSGQAAEGATAPAGDAARGVGADGSSGSEGPQAGAADSVATTLGSEVDPSDVPSALSSQPSGLAGSMNGASGAGSTSAASSMLRGYKFNAAAPAFVPGSTSGAHRSASTASSADAGDEAKPAMSYASAVAGGASGSAEPPAPRTPVAARADSAGTEPKGAADGEGVAESAASPGGLRGAVAAGEEGRDGEEYAFAPLALAGVDIDAAAPPTEDEKAAYAMLEAAADRLQRNIAGAGGRSGALRDQARRDLKQDLAFCRAHACRPAVYARHASTAADFFMKFGLFSDAAEALDGAYQAARMSGNVQLLNTLASNLAAALRKLDQPRRAVALLYAHMEHVASGPWGLASPAVHRAREHLLDTLVGLSRKDEAHSIVTRHVEALEGLLEAEAGERAAAGAPQGGEEAGPQGDRGASAAFAHVDMGKFLAYEEKTEAAVVEARRAVELSQGEGEQAHLAHQRALNLLATLLRKRSHELRASAEGRSAEDSSDGRGGGPGGAEALRESYETYCSLLASVEEHPTGAQAAWSIHRTLADVCLERSDHKAAFTQARAMVQKLAAAYGADDLQDGRLEGAWEYIVTVHDAGGDKEGAANARKCALKCRAAKVKSRDGSHKAKQPSRQRRRG